MATSKLKRLFVLAVAIAAVTVLAVSANAQGRGQGNGGGPGEEAGNNLSVPAIFIGGNPTLNFPIGSAVEPTGLPLKGFPLDPASYYYVQGVHQWQASSMEMDPTDLAYVPVEITGEWGDNLTGSASLTTKKPIRVEIGLLADPYAYGDLTGWLVDKLEPDKLDREAAYGTLAVENPDSSFESLPTTPYPELRVYDEYALLKIYNEDTKEVIVDEPATAEINSTGRVVYGYNLRVAKAGTYVIEFTSLSTTFVAVDNGDIVDENGEIVDEGPTAKLEITVQLNKGSGGGGGRR